jgi:hypothetical protein
MVDDLFRFPHLGPQTRFHAKSSFLQSHAVRLDQLDQIFDDYCRSFGGCRSHPPAPKNFLSHCGIGLSHGDYQPS